MLLVPQVHRLERQAYLAARTRFVNELDELLSGAPELSTYQQSARYGHAVARLDKKLHRILASLDRELAAEPADPDRLKELKKQIIHYRKEAALHPFLYPVEGDRDVPPPGPSNS